MHARIELAGFAAQGVCCLFDRQPVIPLGFSRRAAAGPRVTLLSCGTPGVIAAEGRGWLDANADRAEAAVVLVDGYVTIAAVRTDASILDTRSCSPSAGAIRIAGPYRPH